MEITLNHTIVPSYDNVGSAKFYAKIFGFEFVKEWGHFAVVKVNSTLVLDFAVKSNFSINHYAFKVSEQQFDEIFERIKVDKVAFGSGPDLLDDGEINHNHGGRGAYFKGSSSYQVELMDLVCLNSSPIKRGDHDGRARDIFFRAGLGVTVGSDFSAFRYREEAA